MYLLWGKNMLCGESGNFHLPLLDKALLSSVSLFVLMVHCPTTLPILFIRITGSRPVLITQWVNERKLAFFIHADICSVLTSSSAPWPTILLSPAVGRLHYKERTEMLFSLEWSWIPSKSTGSCKLEVHLLCPTHGLATLPCRVLLFISLWLSGWLSATAQIKIRVDRSNSKYSTESHGAFMPL